MKRVYFTMVLMTALATLSFGQEHKWAFGFYGDMSVKSTKNNSFGVQAKYDLDNRSSIQAQVHGRSSFVSVGADYLFSFLDKKKTDFNVFLGAGAAEDFVSYQTEEITSVKVRDEQFVLNGQIGASYYFRPVNLSLYTGYKVKYAVQSEVFEPNYLMLGVRYHLW